MPAVSKQQIIQTFQMLLKKMGAKEMARIDNGGLITGTYYLDHQPTLGGYRIHVCVNEDGAERVAFGMERLKAKEFYSYMLGLYRGIDFAQKAAGLAANGKTESNSNAHG